MEKFKGFFKEGSDKETLGTVITEAVDIQSKKLKLGGNQAFKESIEDQESNITAQIKFIRDILGKELANPILENEDVLKLEQYIKRKNEDIANRVEVIRDYLIENSGTQDLEAYQEKVESLKIIEGKIRELNHELSSEYAQAGTLTKEQALSYSFNLYNYDQELNRLELEKEMLECEIEKDTANITPEEEIELENEKESLQEDGKRYRDYLHTDPSLN